MGCRRNKRKVQEFLGRNPQIKLNGANEIKIISGQEAPLVARLNGTIGLHSIVLDNPLAADLAMEIGFNGKDGVEAQAEKIVNRVQRYVDQPENRGNGAIGIGGVDRLISALQQPQVDDKAVKELARNLITEFKQPSKQDASSPVVGGLEKYGCRAPGIVRDASRVSRVCQCQIARGPAGDGTGHRKTGGYGNGYV